MDVKHPIALLAGAGTAVIPLPIGGRMDGYRVRMATSTGILRPLECSAVLLEVDGERILLVSVDAVAIDATIVARIRNATSTELSMYEDRILVCATHTHAGPVGLRAATFDSAYELDPQVVELYVSAALSAARSAAESLSEATISYSVGEVVGVAASRRDPNEGIESCATLLSVDTAGGEPIAKVWNFACHATVLSSSNTLISPDLPGEVRVCLREQTRSNLPVVYLPGFGGDISTRFTRREQSPAELQRLARIVVESWQAANVVSLQIPQSWRGTIAFPTVQEDPVDVKQRLIDARAAYDAEPAGPRKRLLETAIQGIERRFVWSSSAHASSVEAEVQAITAGELAFAALPGEPMAATSVQVRLASSHTLTLPVGYANGYIGYLPTSGMNSGYETEAAIVQPGAVDVAVKWFADRLGGAVSYA